MLRDTEKGHQVFFRLSERLDPKIAKPVQTYIRRYCRTKGWAMTELSFKKTHLAFTIKPSSPKRGRARRKSQSQTP